MSVIPEYASCIDLTTDSRDLSPQKGESEKLLIVLYSYGSYYRNSKAILGG